MKDNEMTSENQVPSTPEQEKAIDDALNLEWVKFRMDKGVMDKLRGIAKAEGIVLPAILRAVLSDFVIHRHGLK